MLPSISLPGGVLHHSWDPCPLLFLQGKVDHRQPPHRQKGQENARICNACSGLLLPNVLAPCAPSKMHYRSAFRDHWPCQFFLTPVGWDLVVSTDTASFIFHTWNHDHATDVPVSSIIQYREIISGTEIKTDWDVVNLHLCYICHYEHSFFSGFSCHREVSSISSHSQELKTSFCWAPGHIWGRVDFHARHTPIIKCSNTHTSNLSFCYVPLCYVLLWLTTYGFAIYACIYLFMHVCMCSFICFTVITHFLPFLTSSKASRLKSRHEIKTDLIYFTAHTAALTMHDSPVHVTPKTNTCLCNLSSKCNNSRLETLKRLFSYGDVSKAWFL